jgi:hypothetical protein
MTDLIVTFAARGDLAHLALFLWASSASAPGVFAPGNWRPLRAASTDAKSPA